jgi:uncharacterized delta-60 repeat protein
METTGMNSEGSCTVRLSQGIRHLVLFCLLLGAGIASILGSNGGGPGDGEEDGQGDGLTVWAKSYGGDDTEILRAVVSHPSGDFLLAGETHTHSGIEPNAWFLQVDTSGNALWAKAAGADQFGDSAVMGIAPTTDGGVFICGDVLDPQTLDVDIFVARLTANGNILWMKKSGEPQPSRERALSIATTRDGGCVVGGGRQTTGMALSEWQIQVTKFGPDGDVQWIHTNTTLGHVSAIHQTEEEDYLVGGHTLGAVPKRAFALALDREGSEEYLTVAVSLEGHEYRALTVQENTIGGFLLTAHCETDDTVYAWFSNEWGHVTDQYATSTDAEYIWLEPTDDGEYVMLTRDGYVIKLNQSFIETWRVQSPVANLDHFIRVSKTGMKRYTVVGQLATDEEFLVDLDVEPDGTLLQQSLRIVAPGEGETLLADADGKNGTYFIGGSLHGRGWVRKLDANRDPRWTVGQRRGSADSIHDACISSAASGFDGYVMAGSTESEDHGDSNLWIYAVDTSGQQVWERIYGRPFSEPTPPINDRAQAIVPTEDGYLVAGSTQMDDGSDLFWVLKLDGDGSVLAQRAFQLAGSHGKAVSLSATEDGGAVVVGQTARGIEPANILAVRLGAGLDIVWATWIGGDSVEEPAAILEDYYDHDGNGTLDTVYVIAGTTTSWQDERKDVFVIHLDEDGNVLRQDIYGETGDEICAGLTAAPVGGYLIAGTTTSWGGGDICGSGICPNYFLMQVNRQGQIEWLRSYATAGSDVAYDLCVSSEGGCLLGGTSDGISGDINLWSIRTDSWGNLIESCPGGIPTDATATRSQGAFSSVQVNITTDVKDHIELIDPHLPYDTPTFTQTRQCSGFIELYSLSIQVSGGGRVKSSPTGIDCGENCSFDFVERRTVTLTAHADSGWDFDHWTGDCSGSNIQTTVWINDNKSCVANFVEEEPPPSPINVVATAGNGEVTIQWDLVPRGDSYNIYWSTSANVTTSGTKITGATTPHTHTGLTNGTTYYYVVTAENIYGESAVSNEVSATPQASPPPSPPANVTATAGNGEATITWSAVTGATSYHIYWSTSPNVSTSDTKIAGTTSPYIHTGLSNGTAYYYVVTAENSHGESAVSNEASTTPQAVGQPPSPPTNVAAIAGNGSATISWDMVSGANAYAIYWSNNPNVTTSDAKIDGATPPYTHTGLANGTAYYYVVTAENSYGESMTSNEVNVTPQAVRMWAKTYGGSSHETARSIRQTADGGYIVTGHTDTFGAGSYDFWVVKLTPDGAVEWQKTYGGSGLDAAYDIIQTTDNGFIVTGNTELGAGGYYDFWLLKLHPDGTVQWQKTYGDSANDYPRSIQQTVDGGYVVAGDSGDYVWVLKTDSNGIIEWQKKYGEAISIEEANSIRQTSDGGYIVSGSTDSIAGVKDIWLLKLTSGGLVSWQKTFGGAATDNSSAVEQTTDGGYIVSGNTYSFGAGSYDFWLLKLDSNGNVVWQKTYGGARLDISYSVIQTTDNGYLLSGYTNSFGAGASDVWILKLDSNGNVNWQKTYGGADDDLTISIQLVSDGGFVAAGHTASFGSGSTDFWVLKLDSNGTVGCGLGSSTAVVPADTNVSGLVSAFSWSNSSADLSNTVITGQDTSAIIETQCFAAPSSPANVSAAAGIGEVTINWDPVPGATSYNIYWSTSPNVTTSDTQIPGVTSPYIHSGLTNGTTYYYVVTAEDSYSESDLSIEVSAMPTSTWAKTYGGTANDWPHSIQVTTDGGFIVSGRTQSFGAGHNDMWVLKLNPDGTVAWENTYGETGDDRGNSISQTADGGYVLAGLNGANADTWLVKINAQGTVVWQKLYDNLYGSSANAIHPTSDGGYIVAGWIDLLGMGGKDILISKINSNGTAAWQKGYGGIGTEGFGAASIEQTSDGGYIALGNTISFGAGSYDIWVLKLDSGGSVVWQKTYGGASIDWADSIQPTKDNGYIIAGYTESFGQGRNDAWVLKLNSDGGIVWQKTIGGSGYDGITCVQQTADDGYLLAGFTDSFGAGNYDAWILKLNADGSVAWQKTYGGADYERVYAIQQTAGGDYIVAVYSGSFGAGGYDFWILKIDDDGTLGCGYGANAPAVVGNTNVSGTDTSASGEDYTPTVIDTNVAAQHSAETIIIQCP